MAQLSFEHYEKMTDTALSLEGKANLPLANHSTKQSLFAAARAAPARRLGRCPAGGANLRIRGAGAVTNASISRRSFGNSLREGTLRLGFNAEMDRDAAIELGALAMYEAGDNDRAPGDRTSYGTSFP